MMNLRHRIWLMPALALALALAIAGCGRSNEHKNGAKQTSRWKSYPKSKAGGALGLLLEKEGKDVTARLYDLKSGDGFEIQRPLAAGKYLPDRKAFILPIGLMAPSMVENCLAMKSPYFEVPVGPNPTNLIGTLKSPGLPELPTEFLRFRE